MKIVVDFDVFNAQSGCNLGCGLDCAEERRTLDYDFGVIVVFKEVF